jgi:S1-C subfamily serine protease
VYFDDPTRLNRAKPKRRGRSRIVLAALAAAVAASVLAVGHMLTGSSGPTPVGTGVVVINTNLAYQDGRAAGTGMVLTPSGEVLTNNHVIRGATSIRITLPGTGRSYRATVVGYDVSHDVAVLQATGASNLQTISVGNSDGVNSGQSVRAVGNAGGTGRLTIASGSVTNASRSITVSDDQGGSEHLSGLIETNAAVRPGDSGGPLVNSSGQVIGMDTAANVGSSYGQQTTSAGFAIPINRAVSIVNEIHSGQGSSTVHLGLTAFLGVEASANSYGQSGAAVTSVVPGSPAEAAGLTAGDLITSVGGQAIESPSELSAAVLTQRPGASVSTTYVDQYGTAQTANLTLASGPPR